MGGGGADPGPVLKQTARAAGGAQHTPAALNMPFLLKGAALEKSIASYLL